VSRLPFNAVTLLEQYRSIHEFYDARGEEVPMLLALDSADIEAQGRELIEDSPEAPEGPCAAAWMMVPIVWPREQMAEALAAIRTQVLDGHPGRRLPQDPAQGHRAGGHRCLRARGPGGGLPR
jgi:hypothetical protein